MELLAVFPPLLAFIFTFLFGSKIGHKACQFITCTSVFIAAFASITLFFEVILYGHGADLSYTTQLLTWVTSGTFSVSWALRVDQLSIMMMCVVNIVSSCVHLYSVGYMSHDPARGRFMSYLSLFTFAMLMLVTSDNLLQLFFGWEGVGVASYLLIGFWNQKHSANAAAQKAFIVNRVGDFGLALGMMAIFVIFGSIEFDTIFENPAQFSERTFSAFGYEFHALTVACLLLFMGAVGKSAQLGLHTWLPDAMEGPTPVSALIHAATMVTAGVFLVARFSPVFEFAPTALMVVTVFGATTAFVAATIGMTQFDIKRVIAYSTMSQLGYMFFALGVSAYSAAVFHLMTHAFFKALLFLGAGSVIHAMSNEQDMRNMGGIWKKIPVTYGMMWIGSLALAGFWPFAGYYSKDLVLEAAWADHTWFGHYAFWMGIAAAFMTAFYSWRLIIMTFHGKPRASEKVMSHIHESPSVMILPLVILAIGAVMAGSAFYGGFANSKNGHHVAHDVATEYVDTHVAHSDLDNPYSDDHANGDVDGDSPIKWTREYFWHDALFVLPENDTVEFAHSVPKWVIKSPLVAGVFGVVLAYLIYMFGGNIASRLAAIFAPLHRLFFNKWYFDVIYQALIVSPLIALGRVFWKNDKAVVDGVGPDGFAGLSSRVAHSLSKFQSGFIYQYAFVIIISLFLLISWFVFGAESHFFMDAPLTSHDISAQEGSLQ